MKKKLLATLLAGVLMFSTFSLAACGNGGGGGDAVPAENGDTAAEEADEEGFVRTDWRTPFPEPVTVTIANVDSPGFGWAEGEDIFDNLWTRRWYEEYNIIIETVWASADYDLSLNLAIAAGELPDMFQASTVQFNQLLEAGLLADITDVYNRYASEGMRRLMSAEQAVFETAFVEDTLFAVPQLHYGLIVFTGFLWVRRDFMEELGEPDLSTVAQWEDLMQTWMEMHDAPYAISLDSGLGPFWESLPAWHAHPRALWARIWVDDGQGGIKSGYEMPEMFDALEAWARWFENGWVRPDFAASSWENMTTDIVSGTTGIEVGPSWRSYVWSSIVENFGDDSYLHAFDLPSVDGREVHFPIHFPNDNYNVVSVNTAHPEVLIMLMNDYIYVLNEATIAGTMTPEEVLPFTTNDMHHTTGPFWVAFSVFYDQLEVITAIRTGIENFTSGYARSYFEESMRWINDRDVTALGRYGQMGHDRAPLVLAMAYQENDRLLLCRAWGAHPEVVLDLGGITDSIINEGVTRIIMGLEPVEHFHQVLEEWRAAGGDEMTRAINEYFGN